MARLFDDASSEYLEIDSAPVTVPPFTMACWFQIDVDSIDAMMFVGDKDVADQYWVLHTRNQGGLFRVRFTIFEASQAVAQTSTAVSLNTWHHACAVEVSATDHAVFIDGGSKGTNANPRSPANADRVSIGRFGDSTPDQYFSGRIAEPAIWNVALSDAEVALLAKGAHPLFVQPENIVSGWRLIRDDDQDYMGDFNLTAFNTPSVAEHPPLVSHPAPPFISYPVAAVAGNAMPMAMNYYRRLRVAA